MGESIPCAPSPLSRVDHRSVILPSKLTNIDILIYLPRYRVMGCKPYGVAIAPHRLQAHLNKLHIKQSTALASRALIRISVKKTLPSMLEKPLLDPRKEQ
jgi:hypothetical protein